MKHVTALAIVVGLVSVGVTAYEWRSHNSMAALGRRLAIRIAADADLETFLKDLDAQLNEGNGLDLDSRAGDLHENEYTDEDHNEGYLRELRDICAYREEACWQLGSALGKKTGALTCTFDHFLPKLALPLRQEEASQHARLYFDMAVKLYKAARCDSRGKAALYRQWAAQALGHTIHLVEDMGSPQHAVPENHLDYPLGHGRSFHEYWALDVWRETERRRYTRPDGSGTVTVGGFELAAQKASDPRRGKLEGIMGSMAAESRRFLGGSPYEPGTPGSSLLLNELTRVLSDSDFQPGPKVTNDNDGNPIGWTMPGFLIRTFPSYGRGLPDDRLHGYGTFVALAEPDYEEVENRLPIARGGISIQSFELAERMWAQADLKHPGNPAAFDEKFQTLVTHTTEAAAGAILAFWDEVKNYKCPCYGFTPCAFRAGSKDPDCGKPRPGPKPPGRDYPDDTQGIVGNVSEVKTTSVSQFDSVELGRHWRQIAAVGVEKGLPSLVDFGRTMQLLELAQDQTLTDAGKDELARGMAEMERKYSVRRPRPEDDMAKAAHVGVLEAGFAGEAAAALDALGWTHLTVPLTFDPLQLAENQKVLLVPSGGLYGTSGSAELKERLRAFVEAGGTLIVLAQMLGEDFQTVPTPAGETLKAYGWFEDQSCWTGSVHIAAAHPVTAALAQSGQSVAVDGYLEQWPSQATVLLRKTNGGMPALLAYPLGSGWVAVGTTFSDWARGNGRSSAEDEGLLASLLRWGLDPARVRPVCRHGSACAVTLPVTLHNFTESPADTMTWQVLDAIGVATASWSERRPLGAGETTTQLVNIGLPAGSDSAWVKRRPGIFTLTYTLEDSTRTIEVTAPPGGNRPWVVQPEGAAGQFVVENWSEDVAKAPQVGLGLAVDSEIVLDGSSIPVHLSVRNFGAEAFEGVVRLTSYAMVYPQVAVSVAPGALATYDVSVGPVLLGTGHDGLPGGGFVRAEAYSATGDGPLATATKNLLYDPKLFDFSLQASEPTAGPGDVLQFFGNIANQSIGEVNARYRMTFTNYYSTTGVRCPETKTDWRDLHLARDETVTLDEPYTVPAGCNGIIEATLHLCYPGHWCWVSGNEANASHRSVQVGLPNTVVELGFGEFTVVDGPAFRLPMRVRNIGKRDIAQGQILLWFEQSKVEVESASFDVPRGGEITVNVDLPLPPPDPSRRSYLVGAAFRDQLVRDWSFRAHHDLYYGGGIKAVEGFHAMPGSDSVSGTVRIENRSSTTRHFVVTFDQADLGFHEQRELDIGPFQNVAAELRVPLPSPQTYGAWSLLATATDGALIHAQNAVGLTHYPPSVQIASRPSAPSYRAGDVVTVSVELNPGQLARPIPGTVELTCDQLSFTEHRSVSLTSQQTATESFSLQVPPDARDGVFTYRVRWSGSEGTVALSEGSFIVPPARFEIRALQQGTATAGDTIAYEVRSVGGVSSGMFPFEWRLWGERGWLAQEYRSVSMPFDQAQQITFPIPPSIATGSYWSSLHYVTDGRRTELSKKIEIAGVASTLDVGTGSPVYAYGQPIDGWAKVANGGQAFPNATLTLKVLAPRLCTARIEPWGTFQGSASRQGAAPVGGAIFPPQWLGGCFVAAASLPAAVSPIAVASGDANEDGTDDLIAVWRTALGLSLGVFAGPNLAQASAAQLPGATAAAVAAADTDGDGHLEIFEADTGDGSSLVVRAFDRVLQSRWVASAPVPTDPGVAFPAGGPILADLDGDGRLSLIVSSGRDVLALDALNGAIRWHMLGQTPSFDGGLVTGIAAADADGDGRGEIAVGFRVPGSPASGALALLDGTGTPRWARTMASPLVGSPVMTPEGRIAVVQTPDNSSTPSALTLLDAATGTVSAQTTTPFRSQWPATAGDTNGDGALEYVVASGDPACATCAPRAVLLFSSQGSLAWLSSLDGPPAAPPVLVDMDGDERPDVVADYLTQQNTGVIRGFRGTDGAGLAFEDGQRSPNTIPLMVLDLNGDCLPEILAGRSALRGVVTCVGPKRIASTLATQAQGEVVWRWEASAALAATQLWDISQLLSTNQSTGFFYLVGDLKNSLGQLIAHDESAFSVQWGSVLLSLEPFPQACRPGSTLHATGTMRNAGTVARSFDLVFLLDKVEFARRKITLAAGESRAFSETLAAGGTGTHTLALDAIAGVSGLQYLTQQYRVEEPAVKLTVLGPPAVGQEEFELKAEVANLTQLPVELDVGLDLQDQPPAQREHVRLAGGDKTSLVFRRQVSADTTFVARVSGDATAEEPLPVDYDVEVEPTYIGPSALLAGSTALRLELANAGGHPWRGELLWTLIGATNASGSFTAEVAPASTQNLEALVTLLPGSSILRLESGGVTREFPLAASTGGYGSLEFTVPAQAVEGDVAIALRVANALSTPGSFQVDLEVRDDASGELVANERLAWNLGGDEVAEATVPLDISAGWHALIPRLNGMPVSEPYLFEVLPRYKVEMTATVEAAQPDGTLPLVIMVRNVGTRDLSGTLTVNGLGESVVTPNLNVAVGATAQITVPIDPDLVPAGELPIEVSYATASGQVLASEPVSISVLPPEPVVAGAPQLVEATAGSVAPVEFVVANAGIQTAAFELSFSVNGGALFAGQQEGRLRGSRQQAVRFEVPVPADLASCRLEAAYTLIRIDPATEQGQTVATGRLQFAVHGASVTVTAQVDRDHVTAGATVALTLALEADQLASPLPLFAQVSYPPFGERREFELGPTGAQLRFEVPIEQPGGELGYGIHFTSGRALHLDALTIHPAGGPVEITASQREYRPGEQVQLAVTLNKPGAFEGYGFEQSASLPASGSATFKVPEGLPQGRYPILWTFYGSGPDGGVVNGEYPVKVRGPLVRITRLQAARPADLSGQEAVARAVVTTDTALLTTLRAWLVGPSGQAEFMAETLLELEAGEFREGELRFDLSGAEAGTQSCVVGVYAQDGTLLADAAAQLDLGGGRVLGVRTDKAFYPGAGDTVTALVDVQGAGAGALALRVDGKVAMTRSVPLAGVQRISVLVPSAGAGRHELEAVLESEGRSSSASTWFSVGALLPDLAVDLGGAQIESGKVRAIATVRNIGQSDAPATDLSLWDGEPGTGTLVTELAVGSLAPGGDALVPAEITLTEGKHQVTGWVDRGGRIAEFDRSNNVARFDLVVGPGAQPPNPSTYAVQATSRSHRIGDAVLVEGRAPDGTYCTAVVANGVWGVGDPAPPGALSSATVAASGGVIPQTQVWVASVLGSYDVLLLSQACGAGGTIVAASDPGIVSGFQVMGEAIPVASPAGMLVLVALIALLGAWALVTRRV